MSFFKNILSFVNVYPDLGMLQMRCELTMTSIKQQLPLGEIFLINGEPHISHGEFSYQFVGNRYPNSFIISCYTDKNISIDVYNSANNIEFETQGKSQVISDKRRLYNESMKPKPSFSSGHYNCYCKCKNNDEGGGIFGYEGVY